jgi:hypothetical protein
MPTTPARALFAALLVTAPAAVGGLCAAAAAQAPSVAAPKATTAAAPQQKKCAKCGKANKPTALFCAFCGTKLPSPPSPADEAARLAASAARLLAAGEPAEAERVARDALKKNARNALAHAALGCALAEQDDLDVARVELESAVRLDANGPLAQAGYGVLYAKQGKPDAAERSLRRAMTLDPKGTYAPKKLQELQAGTLAPKPPTTPPDTPPVDPNGKPPATDPPVTPPAEAKNLLDNPDFEEADRRGQIDKWELKFGRGAETFKGGYSGERCIRLSRPGAHIAQDHATAVPGMVPGAAYRVSLRARREFADAGATAQVEIQWKGAGGVALGEPAKLPEFAPQDARWQPFAFDVTVPAEARGFRLRVVGLTAEGGRGNVLLDDIAFAAAATP